MASAAAPQASTGRARGSATSRPNGSASAGSTWTQPACATSSDWRERIGNAVPPAAAEAIAGVMGTTLLLAEAGETFMLSNTPIWVRPVAVALSVAQQEVQP